MQLTTCGYHVAMLPSLKLHGRAIFADQKGCQPRLDITAVLLRIYYPLLCFDNASDHDHENNAGKHGDDVIIHYKYDVMGTCLAFPGILAERYA